MQFKSMLAVATFACHFVDYQDWASARDLAVEIHIAIVNLGYTPPPLDDSATGDLKRDNFTCGQVKTVAGGMCRHKDDKENSLPESRIYLKNT